MALPTKKRPKGERKKRAISYALKKINLISCSKCKKPILPYHICSFCGSYAGKEVLKLKFKKSKKGKKTKDNQTKKEK